MGGNSGWGGDIPSGELGSVGRRWCEATNLEAGSRRRRRRRWEAVVEEVVRGQRGRKGRRCRRSHQRWRSRREASCIHICEEAMLTRRRETAAGWGKVAVGAASRARDLGVVEELWSCVTVAKGGGRWIPGID